MSAVTKIFAGIALIVAGVLLAPYIGPVAAAQLIGIGVSLVLQGVIQVIRGSPGSNNEISKVNVRIAEPIRWLHAGRARAGGAVLFAEFDSAGNLWYLVVHSDSMLIGTPSYVFDEIPVTVDGSGNVLTKDFRLNGKDYDPVETDGGGQSFIQIFTTTYTASNPTPPAISALAAAFPTKWTSDHKLVGTTYSVVKMKALKIEDRFKLYKWRGSIGMGEPSISVIGNWSEMYDPRDVAQDVDDPTTWAFTKNTELIWAWFRMHRYGRNKPASEINWDEVATQADICEENVVGITGTHERYECGLAMPEDRTRTECEQDILLTADAQLLFDEEGKAYARVGYYEVPTLALYRNRDIIAMESIEATNGESETQGVIVRYTEPDANYITQPSAPWYNPLYYVEGTAANFLTVDIIGCNNHNQAMRLAKAIGMRSAPEHRLAPTVGLRGLKAKEERLISLQYDNTFSGDYEITTPVEVDEVGFICSFGITPTDADQWTLLSGEEKPKPVIDNIDAAPAPTNATGVSVSYINGRIEATFTPDIRADVGYQFQTIPVADYVGDATDVWRGMTVIDEDGEAYSEPVTLTGDYYVRHRAVSASGRVSAWSANISVTGTSIITDTVSQDIANSYIVEVSDGTAIISISDTGTLTIDNHTRRYPDGIPDVSVTGNGGVATGLSSGDTRSIAYDDPTRVGGAVTYSLHVNNSDARVSVVNPYRHYVGFFTVPAGGTVPGGGGGPIP